MEVRGGLQEHRWAPTISGDLLRCLQTKRQAFFYLLERSGNFPILAAPGSAKAQFSRPSQSQDKYAIQTTKTLPALRNRYSERTNRAISFANTAPRSSECVAWSSARGKRALVAVGQVLN
jgi:hypothetical protein